MACSRIGQEEVKIHTHGGRDDFRIVSLTEDEGFDVLMPHPGREAGRPAHCLRLRVNRNGESWESWWIQGYVRLRKKDGSVGMQSRAIILQPAMVPDGILAQIIEELTA